MSYLINKDEVLKIINESDQKKFITPNAKHYFLLNEIDALPSIEISDEARGVYQCFHCGSYSVVWGADFSFEDYGSEGEGIVHSCHCANCGAEIEYWVPLNNEDE